MIRTFITAILLTQCSVLAADWPMGGRDNTRNPVSLERGAPSDWQVKTDEHEARNIRWIATFGGRAYGGPIVADGLVWIGTSNDAPLDPAVKGDRGVLACFRESDGKFLYQHASPRLDLGMIADWPGSGLSGSPVTEKDRLWYITNRREVVCLDAEPLRLGKGPAKELWKYDLIKEQGVFPNSPMTQATTVWALLRSTRICYSYRPGTASTRTIRGRSRCARRRHRARSVLTSGLRK